MRKRGIYMKTCAKCVVYRDAVDKRWRCLKGITLSPADDMKGEIQKMECIKSRISSTDCRAGVITVD